MNERRYRVEDLAEVAGVSVDTVRFYQHRGLLPPPVREGRIAYYSPDHAARLDRIRELKGRGLSLETIRRVLEGADPADAALASAVEGSDERRLTLEEVAEAARVPVGLLDSLAEEGLLRPRDPQIERQYTADDVRAIRAGMALLEAGVPLNLLLDLGRRYSEAVGGIAEDAVDLFNEYVRRPSRGSDGIAAEERVVDAFNRLLPAASALVRHTFERAVLEAARRRLEEPPAEGNVGPVPSR